MSLGGKIVTKRAAAGRNGYTQRWNAETMERAKDIRSPDLAVEEEMLRLWWHAGGKKDLSVWFEFPNEELEKAGFTRKEKWSYLQRVEKTKWVELQREKGFPVKVRLLREFGPSRHVQN